MSKDNIRITIPDGLIPTLMSPELQPLPEAERLLDSKLIKARRELINNQEELFRRWLGVKTNEEALEKIRLFESNGYRVRVRHSPAELKINQTPDTMCFYVETEISFHVIPIDLELCERPGCINDMTELKCPNFQQSCIDHCGEYH